MADGKETYPMMPEKNWWELRRKFKQSLPAAGVSISYLSSLLGISEKAAGNIRPTLRKIGLIDDDGIIKDRAKQWRDDEQYVKVCGEIRNELYPQELRDLFTSPTENDRDALARWFANRTAVGDAASKQMASFYILLSAGDITAEAEVKPKTEKTKEKPKSVTRTEVIPVPERTEARKKDDIEKGLNIPSININIEVHIPSEANETQIDKIFESMAKHLNIGRKIDNA